MTKEIIWIMNKTLQLLLLPRLPHHEDALVVVVVVVVVVAVDVVVVVMLVLAVVLKVLVLEMVTTLLPGLAYIGGHMRTST